MDIPFNDTSEDTSHKCICQYNDGILHDYKRLENCRYERIRSTKQRDIYCKWSKTHCGINSSMYIPIDDGGNGFKSIGDTYKIAKIKAAHHINTSDDPRVKLVKTFQKQKEKKMRSMLVCANTSSGDLGLECEFEENKTILKTDQRTMELRSTEFKQINAALYKALTANKKFEVINQPWLGYYTTKIWESSEISPVSKRIHSTWTNIPDLVKSVNDSIKQQLTKTKVYIKNKLMQLIN